VKTKYRLRVVWDDGSASFSVPFADLDGAERSARKWRQFDLVARVEVGVAPVFAPSRLVPMKEIA